MYQKITIIGNLGGDPEMRYTPQGDAVTSFNVATNRRWTGRDGQPGEETCWFRISAWGNLAEPCNRFLEKGRQVFIEGVLTPDKASGGPRVWSGNDGQPRASFEIRASTVKFLSGTNVSDQGGQGGQGGSSMPPQNDPGMSEDEIPF